MFNNVKESHSFYDFSIKSLQNKEINFEDFKDKVVLIVNTASKCGFTPQYTGLQTLYDQYKDRGLVIIGFPCNQFGGQEPGGAKEIEDNCLVNFGVTFFITQKIDVNGPYTHPIFTYLKNELPGLLGTKDIKWNFTKFLIDKTGKPIKRYASAIEPKEIDDDILKLL